MENGENSLIETEADNFAKNSLIPCAEYQTFKKSLINEKNIIDIYGKDISKAIHNCRSWL